MDCQDVRMLLVFSERRAEAIDADAHEAIAHHLGGCPDCAAYAQAERGADEAIGQAMRDVPVPADLKTRILGRLGAPKRRRWPWLATAAATLLLVALGLGLGMTWHFHWSRPAVTMDDLLDLASRGRWDQDKVVQYFTDEGLDVQLPDQFDYQYLQSADVSQFEGRRLPRLTFSRIDDRPATATVLILSKQQYRLGDLSDANIPGTMMVRRRGDFVFVIYYRGSLDSLLLKQI